MRVYLHSLRRQTVSSHEAFGGRHVPAVLYLLELMQKLFTRSTTAVCFARATNLSEITSFKPEYTIHYAILYYTLPNKILYY